nr:MAG TPA: hypothetical protein [Caudoviricetes sp.]
MLHSELDSGNTQLPFPRAGRASNQEPKTGSCQAHAPGGKTRHLLCWFRVWSS